ncbi:hypothetical protein ABW19_dt0202646 [Dactylella cylindrospora]|nr:hypothetical protein ABW19_dt0202646 [Dactylella cylindrospora]
MDGIRDRRLSYHNAGVHNNPSTYNPHRAELRESVLEKRQSQRIPAVAVPLEEKPPDREVPKDALVDGVGKTWTRHAEATWVELFFDLFFVANLTTFTDSHQINDSGSLQSYIGFFALLWFTWLQAALFDIRFAKDSLIQRIAKALQIGVMVGFAAVNSKFDPRHPERYSPANFLSYRDTLINTVRFIRNSSAFKTLSLLLMASRFAIAIQYLVVWVALRQYPKTKMPLLLMSVLMFVSMFIFLGLAFSFTPNSSVKGYIGWYVILALEAILVLGISLKWKIVGFKGTHLIQRMGLLTLIVMGEGIIGLLRATNLSMEGPGGWSAVMSGQAIAGVLCIYFIYMLYFDDEPNYVYSTVPQQLWAILHFPFHLGVVLFAEGQQQLMLWQSIITALNRLGDQLEDAYNDGGQNQGNIIAQNVLDVIEDFFPEEQAQIVANEQQFQFNLIPMRDSGDPTFIAQQIDKLWDLCAYAIFNGYHIEAPDSNPELYNSDEKFEGYSKIYHLVLIYFFVSAGAFLLILAIFTYLMKWPKDRFEWLHISYRTIFGIVIGLIALVATNKTRVDSFLTSGMVVPTMLLLLLLLLVIDKLTILAALNYLDRKAQHRNWLHGQDTGDREGDDAESRKDLINGFSSSSSSSPSSSSSSSSSLSSSSSSSSSGLPAMPGVDNPASDSDRPENGYGTYTRDYYSASRRDSRQTGNSRGVHNPNLEQLEEVSNEDEEGHSDREGSIDYEPEFIGEAVPHIPNSSIPSGNPSQGSLGIPHVQIQDGPQRYHEYHDSPIPDDRHYEEFLSHGSPPLGAAFYNHDRSRDRDAYEERSIRSPVTVVRRSFDSMDSLIPKPLNIARSPSTLSNADKVSTDMPQTHRGFMATPVGYAEGVEGRFGIAGYRPSRDDKEEENEVSGGRRFMRSTESMLGMRPNPLP